MTDQASTSPRASRPSLTPGMRSSSFLKEHQQYRPPQKPESHYGIDTVVEDLQTASTSQRRPSLFKGIPSPENPPKIVDSGVTHDLTHPNCTPRPGSYTDRLIATIFYKTNSPRASNAIRPPQSPPSQKGSQSSGGAADSSIPPTMAPSSSIESFPLEPPEAEPEPLDHLYGSYVSPMCITAFLSLMSTFPLPQGATEVTSSHRCLKLDASQEHRPVVVELTLCPAPSPDYLPLNDLRKHEAIYRFEREWNVDIALRRDTLARRYPRLVVFDMDSTLITQEVIDLLAATIKDPPDLAARVADITHRAMLGELEFDSAFRERVKLLTGLPETIFEELRPVLNVTNGVKPLLRALKKLGVKTAVLSGGFLPLTSWLAGQLGIDYAHANEVVIDPETRRLTGEVKGRIVGKERKRELLIEIAQKEGIALEQVVAVGDGANDLLMMDAAGLGVAWNAKPRVQMEASARLNGDSLLDLLYLFGFTDEEVQQLIA
ncbi:phosphoserine phosphatase-like protein [Thermochaetoides thermophila DSM 1495]|uniref:phosphoserine phosphatase n=1 Tax=Chaetomium thermophilum (strain DSM 1495 / CBS 144.50 / IMI 039719) TaxID=759272 RepID=G0S137_CHATD|nr:phosphoserine phosphatase-like protein [Thermochaetoides thermophila DSM 1495]EGS22747.1 phosphoserine phosphatase-like protein [Thermochaetoides thermophila DSM 1495]